MTKPRRFLCSSCVRLSDTVGACLCEDCGKGFTQFLAAYKKLLTSNPEFRKLSAPQLFVFLAEVYERRGK